MGRRESVLCKASGRKRVGRAKSTYLEHITSSKFGSSIHRTKDVQNAQGKIKVNGSEHASTKVLAISRKGQFGPTLPHLPGENLSGRQQGEKICSLGRDDLTGNQRPNVR